jgi:G3E family GTPase
MLELENGCVCCGPELGKLGESVQQLAAMGEERNDPFEHVVVEMSGLADPKIVKWILADDGIEVDRIVTLVDAPAFSEQWMSWDSMGDRSHTGGHNPPLASREEVEQEPCVANRRVVDLLTAQLEAADVVAINKADMATPSEITTASTTARALAAHADVDILVTKFGGAPLEMLLPSALESHSRSSTDGSHDQRHSYSRATSVDALGVKSFVYTNNERPFSDQRLLGLVTRWPVPQKSWLDLADMKSSDSSALESPSPWKAVLRSKGEIWLDTRHDRAAGWTFAGRHFALDESMLWDDAEVRVSEPENEWGTRRSEFVIIGLDLNEAALRAGIVCCQVYETD